MSHAQPVPGLQLVKPSEMGNGAIVAGEARVGSGRVGSGRVGSGRVWSGRVGSGRVGSGRVGSGHYALDPKSPSYFFRSPATAPRLSIGLRFTGRTLGT